MKLKRHAFVMGAFAALALSAAVTASPAGASQPLNFPGQNCHGGPHGEQVLICDGNKGSPSHDYADRRWDDRGRRADDRDWTRQWPPFPNVATPGMKPLWRKAPGGPL